MRKFKDVLSQLRQERNISQRYLSEQLGLSHSAIGMYENGKREPNYETLEIIADYFNVDMNYLLGKTLVRNSYRELGTIDEENSTYIPDHFESVTDAMEFILRVPVVANNCGYDLDTMSDEEIIEMAEDLSEMLQIMAKKHRKK